MSLYGDIDDEALGHIGTIETNTTAALAEVNAYMPTIVSMAQSLLPPYSETASAVYSPTSFDASGVTQPAFDELGNSDSALEQSASIPLNDLNAGSKGIHPTLKAPIDTANEELVTLWGKAVDLTPAVEFNEDNYIAEIIDEVEDALTDSLTDARDPSQYSTPSENQYYLNDSRRRGAASIKEETDMMAEFSGRGIALPSEVLSSLRSAIVERQAMSSADRDRMVIMQQSTLSQDNKWRAVEAGLRYEQILISYFDRKMQRAFAVAKAGVEVMRELSELQMHILKQRMEVQKDELDLVTKQQKQVAEEFYQNFKAFEARVDELISRARTYQDAHSADMRVYGIRQSALNENRRFVQSEQEIGVDTIKYNVANRFAMFGQNLNAMIQTAGIRMNAASAGAKIQIGIAGAAKNSITQIVGMLTNDRGETSASA